MIVVVAAVIEEHGSFLVTQRPAGTHLGGLWEFPGGKIDPDESHDAALRRELREELDVDATVGELVLHTEHAYADRVVALFFYRCQLQGEPAPLLGQQMRWIPRAELKRLGFPEADEQLIALLTEGAAR